MDKVRKLSRPPALDDLEQGGNAGSYRVIGASFRSARGILEKPRGAAPQRPEIPRAMRFGE